MSPATAEIHNTLTSDIRDEAKASFHVPIQKP